MKHPEKVVYVDFCNKETQEQKLHKPFLRILSGRKWTTVDRKLHTVKLNTTMQCKKQQQQQKLQQKDVQNTETRMFY